MDAHKQWIKDIDEVTGSNLKFPIIADPERKVSYMYDMIDYQDTTNIDEKGKDGFQNVGLFPITCEVLDCKYQRAFSVLRHGYDDPLGLRH